MPNIEKPSQNHLAHDIATFGVIMGIIIASVAVLYWYDSSTHFFGEFSKQVYTYILR